MKYGSMELTIEVNQSEDVAYLARIYKGTKLVSCVFIGGTGKVTVQLPGGVYMIKDGTGRHWYGVQEAFGKYASYEIMTFDDEGTQKVPLEANHGYILTVNVTQSDAAGDIVGAEDTSWEEFME